MPQLNKDCRPRSYAAGHGARGRPCRGIIRGELRGEEGRRLPLAEQGRLAVGEEPYKAGCGEMRTAGSRRYPTGCGGVSLGQPRRNKAGRPWGDPGGDCTQPAAVMQGRGHIRLTLQLTAHDDNDRLDAAPLRTMSARRQGPVAPKILAADDEFFSHR